LRREREAQLRPYSRRLTAGEGDAWNHRAASAVTAAPMLRPPGSL